MMLHNDDMTILARCKDWNLFQPDWPYILQRKTLALSVLCGLSVGLHPAFAEPSWAFNIAIPHLDGTDPDEGFDPGAQAAPEAADPAQRLHEFVRRVHIAQDNLAPYGDLVPVDAQNSGWHSAIRIADFVAWASSMGWSLPRELAPADAAPEPDATPIKETTAQRRARWLAWIEEEETHRPRGALERVHKRELKLNPKADRSRIGREIRRAKSERSGQSLKPATPSALWVSPLEAINRNRR